MKQRILIAVAIGQVVMEQKIWPLLLLYYYYSKTKTTYLTRTAGTGHRAYFILTLSPLTTEQEARTFGIRFIFSASVLHHHVCFEHSSCLHLFEWFSNFDLFGWPSSCFSRHIIVIYFIIFKTHHTEMKKKIKSNQIKYNIYSMTIERWTP